MSSQPPKRRRKRSSRSSEDVESYPGATRNSSARKKKKKNKSQNKKSIHLPTLFAMIGGGVAVLVIIVGLFFIDWGKLGHALGFVSPYERAFEGMITLEKRKADVLETIIDKESAEAAGEPLKQIAIDAAEFSIVLKELDEPSKSKEFAEFAMQFAEKIGAVNKRISKEVARIRTTPGLNKIYQNIKYEARVAGGKAIREKRGKK